MYHPRVENEIITLGIETPCDETAASILKGRFEILSSVVASQNEIHSIYGGVVPELACRKHCEIIRSIAHESLDKADVVLNDLDLVAVTRGPGLVGALLVGLSYAKALAWGMKIPLVGVNHLEGHVMSAFLAQPRIPLPNLSLLVSGGHTELFIMNELGKLEWIGGTRDDAAGEAYDKVAKMLGLGYPGGPEVDRMSRSGSATIKVPAAMMNSSDLDFSFSGPKTAVKHIIEDYKNKGLSLPVEDICASFQASVVRALINKTLFAIEKTNPASISLSGGVAANGALREAFLRLGEELGLPAIIPKLELCQDNAAMIASAGANRYLSNPKDKAWLDFLEMDPKSSWIPNGD